MSDRSDATPPHGPDEPPAIEGEDARASYRYLRIGMVGVVFLLAVSVGIERSKVDCWQTSISAYYYTPVRAVFVGGLMAIGFALIVIKGSTSWEDISLNVAGMLAPVVALVPTSGAGRCWSIEPTPRPIAGDGRLAPWVADNIDNNVGALLATGIAGLVVAAVLAMVANRSATAPRHVWSPGMAIGLGVTFVVLVLALIAFFHWDAFDRRAHGIAAVAMFAFLAVAAMVAAVDRHRHGRHGVRNMYGAIGAGMVGAFAVLFSVRGRFDHWVLVLEVIEIALFAAFWSAQTYERWGEDVVVSRTSRTSGSA